MISLDLYKARRPVTSRHIADVLVGGSPRSAADLYDLALEATAPARRVLARLGRPTDRLLVARGATRAQGLRVDPQLNVAPGRWAATVGLRGDDGRPLVPTLPRLRLTEITLNAKPRQHAPSTLHRDYLLPEPTVREAAAATIIAGQQDALDHARSTVQMRAWSPERFEKARRDPDAASRELGVPRDKVDRLLAGALDTALGGCLDFEHSPFSRGGACTASFLLCLACPNALATPAHLPRLVCLRDALADIASAVPAAAWTADYADHFARITSLLESNTTVQEQAAARAAISARERAIVADMLERRLDA